jgi:hypothetical protein
VEITTCRSANGVAAVLAVYTGGTVNALTRIVGDDNTYGSLGPHCRGTSVRFYAIAGQTYRLAVSGEDPGGRIRLGIEPWASRHFRGGNVRAVLRDGPAFGTIIDVDSRGRTRHTRRNRLLGVSGRLVPGALPGTPGGAPRCRSYHYRGTLLSRREIRRDSCGWGRVTQYAHMYRDERSQAAAITSQELALHAHSLRYTARKVREARKKLKAVSETLYSWGEDAFEETDMARFTLRRAQRDLDRATVAPTKSQRERLHRQGRIRIRNAVKLTRSALGTSLLHFS